MQILWINLENYVRKEGKCSLAFKIFKTIRKRKDTAGASCDRLISDGYEIFLICGIISMTE